MSSFAWYYDLDASNEPERDGDGLYVRDTRWRTLGRILPTRLSSRVWGFCNNIPLPYHVRSMTYKTYSKVFGCNLDEIHEKDLRRYANLQQFFMRRLDPQARVVSDEHAMVCPTDSTLINCGPIKGDLAYQIKGVAYSIKELIKEMPETLAPGRDLFQAIFYLSPGDYHRFHSPCDFAVKRRLHINGQLLSVSPRMARQVPGLFSINERVVLNGFWEHGFMSFVAVGAYNVGSIFLNVDNELKTNKRTLFKLGTEASRDMEHTYHKGEEMGGFKLGSTVILVFEAPKDFEFSIKVNDKVKMGLPLGSI